MDADKLRKVGGSTPALQADPASAAVEYLAIEDEQIAAMEAELHSHRSQHAEMKQQVGQLQDMVKQLAAAVDAMPKMHGYHFCIQVPAETTKSSMEEQLKAAWATHKLEHCCDTEFCVVLTEIPCFTCPEQHVATVTIFHDSEEKSLTPIQAKTWVMSVRDSEIYSMHCIQLDAELECIRARLSGQNAWGMWEDTQGQWEAQILQSYKDETELSALEQWMLLANGFTRIAVYKDGQQCY